MRFEVVVRLKPEVLDPQGRAIQQTLTRLGFKDVGSVDVSKRYEINVNAAPQEAKTQVEALARDYLANSVAETYSIKALD